MEDKRPRIKCRPAVAWKRPDSPCGKHANPRRVKVTKAEKRRLARILDFERNNLGAKGNYHRPGSLQ